MPRKKLSGEEKQSRHESKTVKKKKELNEKKIKRNIFLKLGVNFLLEIFGFAIIVTILLTLQTTASCNKQKVNSQTKLDEIVEIMADNIVDKQTLISQYDDFNIEKANTVALFLQNYKDQTDVLFTEVGRQGLIELSKESKYNLDGIFIVDIENPGQPKAQFYSRKYPNMTAADIGFNVQAISQFMSEDGVAIKDQFIPFTYDHSNNENPIIEDFEDYYGDGTRLASRYYGSKLNDTMFVLIGTDPIDLYKDVHNLVGLNYILSDIKVGKSGYVLAIDSNDNITYHPDESLIGTNYKSGGLSSKVLKDGYSGWQTIEGREMYCVSSSLTYHRVYDVLKEHYDKITAEDLSRQIVNSYNNVKITVAAVSKAELNKNRIFTTCVVASIFFVVALIQIFYLLFVKKELLINGNQKSKKITKHLYFNSTVARKVTPITLLGVIVIVALTAYIQALYSLSSQIDTNEIYLSNAYQVLETNSEQSKDLTQRTDDLYYNKLDVIKYTLLNNDSIHSLFVDDDNNVLNTKREDITDTTRNINKEYLQQVAKTMGVREIYLYNLSGNTIATSSNYQDFDLSTNEKEQSYPFWEVLKGHLLLYSQEAMTSDLGMHSKYFAKPLQKYYNIDSNGNPVYTGTDFKYYDVCGMIQIEVDPTEYNAKTETTDISNVLENMIFGTNGFAFAINKSNNTIKYYPKTDEKFDYEGKQFSDIGLPESALKNGYFGKLSLNEKTYWVSSMEYEDYYVYAAIPNNEVFDQVAMVSMATAIICFVMLSIFSLIYTITTNDETEESEFIIKNAQFANVTMPDGRTKKVTTAQARWGNAYINWFTKSSGQKLAAIIRGSLTLLGAFLALLMFTDIFSSLSVVNFIKDGQYESGFNVFSATNAICFAIVIIVIADLIKLCCKLILRNADARVETVGRLITNLIKYAVVIWIIFRTLGIFGINTSTLITGASVLSIIIGLGSQSLIGDILAGLFIVFEGEFRVGDIVTIDDWRGTVLEIGLRTTKVEDVSKNIKIFTNSSISGVVNMTKEYSYATCIIGVEYGENLERIEAILSTELPKFIQKLPSIKDGPFYKGVDQLGESCINLKILALCDEVDRLQLERDLNREMKLIFDKYNINIPFPQVVVQERTPDMTNCKQIASYKKEAEEFVSDQKEVSKGIED